MKILNIIQPDESSLASLPGKCDFRRMTLRFLFGRASQCLIDTNREKISILTGSKRSTSFDYDI